MKYIYLSSFSLLFSFLTNAQNFSNNNEPAVGFDAQYFIVDSNITNLSGTVGNSATWDYGSAIGYDGANQGRLDQRVRVLDPNSTAFAGDYPGATKVIMIDGFILNYWFSGASNRMYLGFVMPNTDLEDIQGIYSNDPQLLMEYPFNFDDEVNDQMSGSMKFTINGMAQNEACDGVSFSKFDGLGTFIAPDGTTINNVKRWVVKDTVTVTLQVFGDIDLIREQYQYFDNDASNMPVFMHMNLKAVGNNPNPLIDETLVLSRLRPSSLDNAGINELSSSQHLLYPNPVRTDLFLDGEFAGAEFEVMDMQGKEVMNGQFSGKLNVEELEPGIYFLKLTKDASPQTFRFEKLQ